MIASTKTEFIAAAIIHDKKPTFMMHRPADFTKEAQENGIVLLYGESQVLALENEIQRLRCELSAAQINNPVGLGQH